MSGLNEIHIGDVSVELEIRALELEIEVIRKKLDAKVSRLNQLQLGYKLGDIRPHLVIKKRIEELRHEIHHDRAFDSEEIQRAEEIHELLNRPESLHINHLNLDTATHSALRRNGINYIPELMNMPRGNLIYLRNIGPKRMFDIYKKLDDFLENNATP